MLIKERHPLFSLFFYKVGHLLRFLGAAFAQLALLMRRNAKIIGNELHSLVAHLGNLTFQRAQKPKKRAHAM